MAFRFSAHAAQPEAAIEEMARDDALLDALLQEPLWYPLLREWRRTGLVTEQEWRWYQRAYTVAQQGTSGCDA